MYDTKTMHARTRALLSKTSARARCFEVSTISVRACVGYLQLKYYLALSLRFALEFEFLVKNPVSQGPSTITTLPAPHTRFLLHARRGNARR